MKHLILTILIWLPFMATAAPKAMGDVAMTDGSVYKGVEVEIPAGTMEEVKIKVDGKKIKLKSELIDHLILWHKDNPELKHFMVYSGRREIDYEKNLDKIEDYKKWFVLMVPGEYVSIWIYACGIDVGKKGINMSPCNNKYGYNTFYNLWKKGDNNPVFLKFNRKQEKMETWLARFLADDPEFAARVLDKEYRTTKYKDSRRFGTMLCPMYLEKIAEDYHPKK